MLKTTILSAALAATFIISSGASIAAAASGHMKTLGRTSQPIGHAMFCQQFPSECRVKARTTKAPKLTRKRWKEIVSINSQINRMVTPVTDMDYYGVEEHWTYPRDHGDCEDYVLLKRHMLMQNGWPASSLLITVVKQPNGDGHAVLTVRTDRADYVLDNLSTKVKQWNKTPYRYIKRQSARHSGHWITIRDRRAEVASY